MPIRPCLRKFYGTEWKRTIRPRILERAGQKCQHCGKPNQSVAYVYCEKVNGCRVQCWVAQDCLVWRNSLGLGAAAIRNGRPLECRGRLGSFCRLPPLESRSW